MHFLNRRPLCALLIASLSSITISTYAAEKFQDCGERRFPAWEQPQPAVEKIDLTMYKRIREEGLQHSHVMEYGSALTDGIGPRLTGSPNMAKANAWTRDQLTKMGCVNAHLEDWGEFGMGWQQLNTWVAHDLARYRRVHRAGHAVVAFDQWPGKRRGDLRQYPRRERLRPIQGQARRQRSSCSAPCARFRPSISPLRALHRQGTGRNREYAVTVTAPAAPSMQARLQRYMERLQRWSTRSRSSWPTRRSRRHPPSRDGKNGGGPAAPSSTTTAPRSAASPIQRDDSGQGSRRRRGD